jgi:preprotein translocase subunit YajC
VAAVGCIDEPPAAAFLACGRPRWWAEKRTDHLAGIENLIFLALLIGIFYFMLIRPQKRRVEQHKNLVESISDGDEVVTIGGIYGTVMAIGDDEIELEVSPGTRVRFVKSAIARRITEDLDEEEYEADDTSTQEEDEA